MLRLINMLHSKGLHTCLFYTQIQFLHIIMLYIRYAYEDGWNFLSLIIPLYMDTVSTCDTKYMIQNLQFVKTCTGRLISDSELSLGLSV